MKKTPATKTGATQKAPAKAPSKATPKPAAKAAPKAAAQPKQGISNKPCDKKADIKHKSENTDKRAFVSGEAPNKVQKLVIKKRDNMKCIKTIEAHEDWVEKVLLLSNGKLITTSQDGLVKSWDMSKSDNKPLSVLEGHQEAVMDVIEFGKDKIITTSKDRTIRKWNVSAGKELFCYKSDEPIYCVKKIDDTYIAVAGADKSIRILDFSQDVVKEEDLPKVQTQRLEGHDDEIMALEIGPGVLISASIDKSINIYSLKDYKLIKKLTGHTDGVKCLKVLKDGNLASGAFDNNIKIWDLKTFQCIKTLTGHTGHVFAVNQLPDERIISGASDWSIIVWGIESGKPDFILEGHEEAVYSIDVYPDGKVISGSVDHNIKLWD